MDAGGRVTQEQLPRDVRCESIRGVIAKDGMYAENAGRLKGLRWYELKDERR
jgi:hypothetical protein